MMDGDMDAGAWSCGMVAGLIHDIPTCKELIDRIMKEADIRQPAGRARTCGLCQHAGGGTGHADRQRACYVSEDDRG
jgi:hypothetical protein